MTIQKCKTKIRTYYLCHRFVLHSLKNRYEKEKRRLSFTSLYVNTSLIDVLKFWFLKLMLLKLFNLVLTNFFFGCCEEFWFLMRLMIYFELLLCVILSFTISNHYSMKLSTIKTNFKILSHSKSMIMMVSQHINHYNIKPKVVTENRKYSIDGNWQILNSNILNYIYILIIHHNHLSTFSSLS
jgi:hypothetical protein